jgi:hypothetical protein
MQWWQIALIVFGVILVAAVITWLVVSRSQHGRRIRPGDSYTVLDKRYTVPPTLDLQSPAYLLNESIMIRLRNLVTKTLAVTRAAGRTIWATYGTLLGFERHGTIPIPWDDDADFDTDFENRHYFYSPQFGADAKAAGLDAIKLFGSSAKSATKEGSAVRLRLTGTKFPTLDIFFNRISGDRVAMVETWSSDGVLVESTRKRFPMETVFPLASVSVDGFDFQVPARPEEYLKILYGNDVLTTAKPRPLEFSHVTPFTVLDFVWVPL